MNSGFYVLSSEQRKHLAKTMSEAFLHHENFCYLIEEDNKRLEASYYLFLFMAKVINKYGKIYVVKKGDESIGYITFMDDQRYSINVKTVLFSNSLFLALRFWFKLSKIERKRYKQYLKKYNELKHDTHSRIHLYYTGINPLHKGKGYMKKAMNDAFVYFIEEGYKGVTLETSDSSNVGLYKHLGYRIIQSVKSDDERQEILLFEKDF